MLPRAIAELQASAGHPLVDFVLSTLQIRLCLLFPVKTREGFGQACSAYMGGLRSFIEGIAGLAGIQWGAGQYTFHGTSGAWHLSSARFPGKPSKTMSTKRQPGELSRRLVLAGASWLYARIQLVAIRAGKKFAMPYLRPGECTFYRCMKCVPADMHR